MGGTRCGEGIADPVPLTHENGSGMALWEGAGGSVGLWGSGLHVLQGGLWDGAGCILLCWAGGRWGRIPRAAWGPHAEWGPLPMGSIFMGWGAAHLTCWWASCIQNHPLLQLRVLQWVPHPTCWRGPAVPWLFALCNAAAAGQDCLTSPWLSGREAEMNLRSKGRNKGREGVERSREGDGARAALHPEAIGSDAPGVAVGRLETLPRRPHMCCEVVMPSVFTIGTRNPNPP